MSKMIKTSNTNIKIELSTINVVKIGDFQFEIEEGYPWVDVYLTGGECKDFVTQIDETDGKPIPTGIEDEEFKIFCLNWFFDNVEVASETDVQKQINKKE